LEGRGLDKSLHFELVPRRASADLAAVLAALLT
jgi:hypothetical protein